MAITPTSKIWMDGEFVDWADATVHVLTHTMHYGSGVFEGITRRTVREVCAALGLPFALARLHADALRAADEVFLSSTAGGIMPVTRLDGRILGNGTAGPVTRQVLEAYWEAHADPRLATPVDYAGEPLTLPARPA